VVLLWFAGHWSAKAQCIKHLNAHQFLGASNVYHVVKDRSGYLWFCTSYGLVKYNGHSIQRFTRQQGLADNMVFNIFEDGSGRIWPFCLNGKYCFIKGDSIHNESNDPLLAALPHTNSYITYMAEDQTTGLYIGFISKQILILNNGTGKWLESPFKEVNGFIITPRSIRYSGTASPGFVKFIDSKSLVADKKGIKILSNSSPQWELNDPTLTDRTVTDICLTEKNSLIICTNHGLVIIDLATKERSVLLKGIKLSGCTSDISGNFWISTANNGIYVLHRELDNILPLKGFEGVECVTVNDNRVVSIKDGNLYEFTAKNDGVKAVRQLENVHNYYNPVMLAESFAAFYNTWKDSFIISDKNGSIIHDRAVFFKKIYTRGNGDFVAFGKGLVSYYLLGKSGARLLRDRHYRAPVTTSSSGNINDNIFFVCGTNLYKCNFLTADNDLVFSSPLLGGAKSVLVQDTAILITTDTPGYYTLYPADKNGRLYYTKSNFIINNMSPLAGNKIVAFSDAADFIIGPSGQNHPQMIRYPFSSADYEHLTLLGNYCLVQLDGQLYYFDTSLLNKHIPSPLINIRRLVINGQLYDSDSIEIRNTMKLVIQLVVGIIDFGRNLQDFSYRLSGPDFDGKWVKTTATELIFVLRKAGQYRIEIATNPLDGSSSHSIVRTITVHTPFLRSATFFVSCSIILLIICGIMVLLVLRYRERHFLRAYNYLKLEHRAINALLNPHFIFNTVNNIQNLIFKSDGQEAADYLSALSRLIRQNLENIQHNLIPLDNEIEMIGRYIRLQNLRFEGKISLLVTEEYDRISQVYIPPLLLHTFVENAIVHGYRGKSEPFSITLAITKEQETYLRITITDNGIGIDHAGQHPATHQKSSMGIAFNQKRLDRLSEFYRLKQSVTVTDLSASGQQGTEVVIILYAELKTLFEQQHLPVY
jgi:hypothetical protein